MNLNVLITGALGQKRDVGGRGMEIRIKHGVERTARHLGWYFLVHAPWKCQS